MQLPPELKCLVKYVRDKCSMAGIWNPNWTLANMHINSPRKLALEDLLSIDEGGQFLKLDDGKIFCIGFPEFQYGENLNEKSPVHKKVIDLLKKSFYKKHTLFDTLSNGVLNTPKEKEEEEEKEEDKEKEEEKDPEFEVLVWPTFDDLWKLYDKKVGEKGKLKKKWDKIPQVDKERIMEHVLRYKVSQPDKQYRKNLETYLNQKSWEDEIIGRSALPQTSSGSMTEEFLKEMTENE